MDNLTSFVFGGTILIFVYIVFLTFTSPNLIRVFRSTRLFKLKKLLPQIFVLSILSLVLSFSIFLNSIFSSNASNILKSRVGQTTSLIYSRNEGDTWNEQKTSEIYSKVSRIYDKYLPAYYLKADIIQFQENKAEDVILINYDLIAAGTYNSSVKQDFDSSQVVISKSISDELGINENNEINIQKNSKSLKVKVDKVIDDNGLIGFTFPTPSRLSDYKGSIYLPYNILAEINGLKSDEFKNNIIFLNSSNSEAASGNETLSVELLKYDRDLILEEIQSSYLQKILGNYGGLNISQIIFLFSLLPIFTLLILNFYFDRNYFKYIEKNLSILRVNGLSSKENNTLELYLNLLKALISSICGFIITLLFIYGFFNSPLSSFFNITNYNIEFNTLMFAVCSTFILIFLLSNLRGFTNVVRLISLKYLKQIKQGKKFKIQESSFSLILIFGGIVSLYYVNSSFITDNNLKFYANFYILQLIFATISFVLTKYYPGKSRNIFVLTTCILLFVNILPLTIYSDLFKANVYIELISYSVFIIFLTLIVFSIISLIPTILINLKISIPKSFIVGSKLLEKFKLLSFISLVIFFLFSMLFVLSNYSSQVFNQLKSDSEREYDLYISDNLGLEDPIKFIDRVNNFEKIDKVNFISFGFVEFKDIKNKDLKNYDAQKFPSIQPDQIYTDYAYFVNDEAFKTIEWDRKSEFLNSDKYIVLSSNYLNNDSLIPNLKVGDKVKLSINGIEFDREILSTLDNKSVSQGVYFSFKDYLSLRAQKVYLNHSYAFDIKDNNFNKNALSNELNDSKISSIFYQDALENQTLRIADQIINSLNIILFISLILVLIALTLIVTQLFSELLPQKKTLYLSFIIYIALIMLTTLIISFISIPKIIELFHQRIIIPSFPNIGYSFDKNIILTWQLSILIISLVIWTIIYNLKYKDNGKR